MPREKSGVDKNGLLSEEGFFPKSAIQAGKKVAQANTAKKSTQKKTATKKSK